MVSTKAPITKTNIMRKVNRKKNPVTSIAQLAREFGVNTSYYRWDDFHGSVEATAAPRAFREKVKSLVGLSTYNQIRDAKSVNVSYR